MTEVENSLIKSVGLTNPLALIDKTKLEAYKIQLKREIAENANHRNTHINN